MIVAPRFPGGDARLITGLPATVDDLFGRPRFDHRVIQEMHDLFAGAFRHSLLVEPLDDLEKRPTTTDDERLQAWREFAAVEFRLLARDTPAFLGSFVEAIRHENTEHGYEAEERLAEYVRSRFADAVKP